MIVFSPFLTFFRFAQVLQLEGPKRKREWTIESGLRLNELYDRPWEGFAALPFGHKTYLAGVAASNEDSLRAVRDVLEAPGFLQRFVALCVLDHHRSGDSKVGCPRLSFISSSVFVVEVS